MVMTMLDPRILEDIGARLGGIMAASPAADIEKNARTLLASAFAKLDLVSREEFDIQTQVLQRTREKLKALEVRLERLEKEAVALAVTLDRLGLLDADAAGLPAQVLPPAIRTLPSTQSRQQARIAALEQRVRALERLGAETGEAAAGAQRP